MAGYSIPASEHSSMTSWGGKEFEIDACRNILDQFAKPGAIVACVSDSYDIYNCCEHIWGETLRQKIIDSKATLVVRPDSGDPATVVLRCLDILSNKFGFTVNSKNYKVLNNVRIIQGDGVNETSIKKILDVILNAGYSATNVGFGCGGFLMQDLTRDTNRWAMKCSSVITNGKEIDVYKDPITDSIKKSKKGRLDLIRSGNTYETVRLESGEDRKPNSVMQTVFENGKILKEYNFDEIRELANQGNVGLGDKQ
jgi:nicotinamide phosphoribosyltransferase